MDDVKVSVSQFGGVMDIDKQVELAGGVARLSEGGALVTERPLGAPADGRVEDLAGRAFSIIAETVPEGRPSAVLDVLDTVVTIEIDGDERELRYQSGEVVPSEVADLVRAMLEAPYRDPRQLS